jgi:hypothetical protein
MSVFGDKRVFARHGYDCDYCGNRIKPHERYFTAVCNDDNKVRRITMHMQCANTCIKNKQYLGNHSQQMEY